MSGETTGGSQVARRAAAMSKALSEAARRARFSTRSRRRFDARGFSARRGARALRLFAILGFALLVAAPTVAAGVYFAFIASDQYVAEAQFTVIGGELQAGGGSSDAFGAATNVPVLAIIQDTQIVSAYLESRAAVEALNASLDLRKLFGAPSIDVVSRFREGEPIEELVRYWRKMTSTTIKMPSGIIEFRVRAFTPADARRIGEAVVEESERLINDLNARMQSDAVSSATAELKRAGDRLAAARARLEEARNEEGVLDASRAADALEKLLGDVRGAALTMQQEYQALMRSVNESSPQMKAMRARIDAGRAQIADLEAKLTSTRGGGEKALSASMTRFAMLDLERQISERLFTSATATLELARLTAEHRLMYLKTFVSPVTPEEPLYPRRALNTALIFAAGLAAWGCLYALASAARNNMA
jgi:capsular polysaccharide transport system permease protein